MMKYQGEKFLIKDSKRYWRSEGQVSSFDILLFAFHFSQNKGEV